MQGIVLSYHFPAKKAAKLRMVAMKLGVRVREVQKWEYLETLAALVGDAETEKSVYDGADFQEEMLLMAHLSPEQLDRFIGELRSVMPPVSVKAVLTETNRNWNSLQLFEQISAERDAIAGK